MDINTIIAQHGKSVALSFSALRITYDVTANNLMLAVALYGQPFIDVLQQHIETEQNYTQYEGWQLPVGFIDAVKNAKLKPPFNAPQTLPTVTVGGKTKAKKVTDILGNILAVIGAGAGAYVGAKNKQQPQGNDAAPTPEQKKHQYFLFGGIALIVILAIILITQKK